MMDDKDKASFFRMVKGLPSGERLQVVQRVIAKKVSSDVNVRTEGGTFLPLSVWKSKGYDVERIMEHSLPEDIREHDVLGPCYRVKLLSAYNKRTHGDAFEDVQEAGPSGGSTTHAVLTNKEKVKVAKQEAAEKKNAMKPVQRQIAKLESLESKVGRAFNCSL